MRDRRAWLLFLAVALIVLALAYQFSPPMQIDVGERSANPYIQGFYFREQAGFGAFRWSGPVASLSFRGVGSQAGLLRLKVAAPAGRAVLCVNGKEVAGGVLCGGEVREYVFELERAQLGLSGDLVVTLKSETFSAPPDTRELGGQVISASFEPRGGFVLPAFLTMLYTLLDAILVVFIARVWSGSTKFAWAAGAAAVLLMAWGLAVARLETAWLVRVGFWLGLGLCALAWAVIWLLRRFYPLEARTLRLMGLFALVALALRMPFAVQPGFIVDIQDYVIWSYKLTRYGLASAYVVVEGLWIVDYPPVLPYLFQALGALYQKLFAPDFLYPVSAGDPALRAATTNAALLADPIHRTLLRLPAILADLIAGALIFTLARRKASSRTSFLIASAYWFNPATVYNSSVYGQTDAVHTLLVVLSFALVETARAGWAFLALAVGGLTKPQAFVFGPLLLLRAFQRQRWRGVVQAGIGGAAGLVLTMAPMIGAGAFSELLSHFSQTVGHHPVLSANAHNFWWLITRGNVGVEDTTLAFSGLSYRAVGLLLFALVYVLTLIGALRRPQRDLWGLGAYIGFAFFLLPTEIHENYAFAVLALLAVAMVANRRYAWLYAILSLTMVANYALHDPNVYALLDLHSPHAQLATARWLNAVVNVSVFAVWSVWEILKLRASPGKALNLS